MAEKDKQTQTDDELVPVGPGAEDTASQEDEPSRAAGEDYSYEDEGGEEGGEERAGHAEQEDEGGEGHPGESPSARRRRRLRERQARDQRELNFLRTRNEQLEREHSRKLAEIEGRQNQSDITALDGRIAQAEADVREAEALFEQALEKKDSGAVTEALRVRDELRDGLTQLKYAKGQVQRQVQARAAQPAQQPQQRQVDPAVARRAQEWIRERTWFDPTGADEDSAIAYTIEQRLYNEGRLDASGDEYYDELDRRLAKRLPHRYRKDASDEEDSEQQGEHGSREGRPVNGKNNGQRRASGGPTFRTGGRERALRKGEVYIDADRKAAMIEHGVWDDPEQRQRYLAQYAKYDRENGRRRH